MSSAAILDCSPLPVPGGRAANPGIEIRELTYRGLADFARHHHDYASLFVMLNGQVREQARREPVDCPAGAIGFIPAGVPHRSTFCETPSRGLTVILRDQWLSRLARDGDRGPDAWEPGYAKNPIVSAAAFRLYAACLQPDAARALAVEEQVVELLGWATGQNGHARREPHPPGWLKDVTGLIREAETGPIGLGDLSDAVARHPGHVCRAFKSAFGCSMSEYAQLVRVERACGLLQASDRGLASVALATGFYDQAHFTRVFRRHIGVTPRAYRRCFRGTNDRANPVQDARTA